MSCIETPTCITSCKALPNERPRYFTGRLLTARDLADAQEWLLSKLRLRNRLFHGYGIACGLEVVEHPQQSCKGSWVVVKPGLAVDCCGREIVVCDEGPIEVLSSEDKERGPWIICLRYAEMGIEPQPVIAGDMNCRPGELVPSRVRETFVIEAIPLEKLPKGCWPARPPGPKYEQADTGEPDAKEDESGCADCGAEEPGDCFEPNCRCGDYLPLALIRFDSETNRLLIESDARPVLASTHQALTHICRISWPHGGEMTVQQLREAQGRLVVTFDRPLKSEGLRPGVGIGRETFRVVFREAQAAEEVMICQPRPSVVSTEGPGRCEAVFTIPPRFWSHGGVRGEDGDDSYREESLVHNVITVTLRCDFILDIHGNPVDGEHLRGLLPSGNGTAGGDFVSWFRVVEG